MSSFQCHADRRHSLFLSGKFYHMVTILSVAVIITLVSLAVFQAFKNYRTSGYVDVKSAAMPRLLCALAILFCCGMLCGQNHSGRLLCDTMVAVVYTSSMVLSVKPAGRRIPFHIGSLPALIPLLSIYYILCATGLLKMLPTFFFLVFAGLMAVFNSGLFLWMLWWRLRDVKSVMKSGNVWSFVTLCVDIVYTLSPLMIIYILYPIYVMWTEIFEVASLIAVVLLVLEVVAVALRVSYDSAFVILHDHERVIVESMKISHMELSSSSDPKGEEQYKELYERIVLYFEMSRPYLDGDLTINDVVKVVYSNKVYISKAIFHYTGRNFRQFVNYYRIMYSMTLFRENLEMKVAELAEKSGFNTMVSYTMAFRLFMNETPSEWCRKERSKILKTKK